MEQLSKFKGIFIPRRIWENDRLTIQDMLVWAIMESQGRENFNIEDTAKKFKTTPEKILLSVERLFELRLVKEVRYV